MEHHGGGCVKLMTSVLAGIADDLRPQSEIVVVGTKELKLRGLSAGELGDIARRFPSFSAFLNEGREAVGDADVDDPVQAAAVMRKVDVGKSLEMGADAWPAVIATALGEPNDPDTEKLAAGMAMTYQQVLVAAAMRLSFPRPLEGNGASPPS